MPAFRPVLHLHQFAEWVVANALGWVVGFATVELILPVYTQDLAPVVTLAYTLGAAVLGLGQWLSLRRFGVARTAWVPATTFGFLAGYVVFRLAEGNLAGEREEVLSLVGLVSLVATGVGVGQWLILRSQFRHAGWWILAVLASWLSSMGLGVVLRASLAWGAVPANLVVGLVSGIVTGSVLWWLSSDAATHSIGSTV